MILHFHLQKDSFISLAQVPENHCYSSRIDLNKIAPDIDAIVLPTIILTVSIHCLYSQAFNRLQ